MEAAQRPIKENSLQRWARILRPLSRWVLLVIVLFALRAQERWMEETRLSFSASLGGRRVDEESILVWDGKRVENGGRISLGWHKLSIYNDRAVPFSTNLFIWYGPHNLGNIALTRARGILTISAKPSATSLTVQGPEFSVQLTNTEGITTNVPTDHYTVEASYSHWRERRVIAVSAGIPRLCAFTPRLGVIHLTCNKAPASFQLANNAGEMLEAGDFPASVGDVPEGSYVVNAWHGQDKVTRRVWVGANETSDCEIEFVYGAAAVESEPPGATILTADGQALGVTPLILPELRAGEWHFQLRLAGYSTVSSVLNVLGGQTNTFRTNLVGINYGPAMDAARLYLGAGDYDRAISAAEQALQAKPGDAAAAALRNEADGKRHLRNAVEFGKQGNYIGGMKELESAQQLLPDNAETKQLLEDFKAKAVEQREQMRLERLVRGQKVFDSLSVEMGDPDLFESHELKTTMRVNNAENAIAREFGVQSPFRIVSRVSPQPETFAIEVLQDLPTFLGTSGGRRKCLIVGNQMTDTETQILYRVLEYKAEAVNKLSIGAWIGAPAEVTFVPIHPSRVGPLTDKLKAQLEDGQRIVGERIQRAIGGDVAGQK